MPLLAFVVGWFSMFPLDSAHKGMGIEKRNPVYVEFMGNAPLYAVGFGRERFSANAWSFFYRIAAGTNWIGYTHYNGLKQQREPLVIFLPFEISWINNGDVQGLETGLGFTFTFTRRLDRILPNKSVDAYLIDMNFIPRVGFRIGNKHRNLFLRVAFTPWINIRDSNAPFMVPRLGAGVGYYLNKR